MGSTGQRPARGLEGDPESEAEDRQATAVSLVTEADHLLGQVLKPARWPQRRTVSKFLQTDALPRVLTLYQAAMQLDPEEPAFPWNLASSLSRLGLNALALAYIEEAIRIASETGDSEWADAHAHLAWADMAFRARQFDIALLALARAKRLGERQSDVLEQVQRLLKETRKAVGSERPAERLAQELKELSA